MRLILALKFIMVELYRFTSITAKAINIEPTKKMKYSKTSADIITEVKYASRNNCHAVGL